MLQSEIYQSELQISRPDYSGPWASMEPIVDPVMTILAMQTERIQIGTGILNVFSRTPGAIAQEFAALEQLSNGRMVCDWALPGTELSSTERQLTGGNFTH